MVSLKTLLRSPRVKKAIATLGLLAAALLIFAVGEAVGNRKAAFSYLWSENYLRNFAGPPRGPGGDEFLESHGVAGSVIKTGSSTLIVQDRDEAEKEILLTASTVIRKLRKTISASGIQENDSVVVIGSPNSAGQIQAKLIRVFPTPPSPLLNL